jgi:hypothetical protein
MNAGPFLHIVMRALQAVRLEAILIGNAAAALRGAPVTTEDFDFLVRSSPVTRAKIERLASLLHASISMPYYPASNVMRLQNRDGLKIDLLPRMAAIRSFESLRSRSEILRIGDDEVRIASLEDVVRSKRAANRPKDRAVLPILNKVLREQKKIEGSPQRPSVKSRPRRPRGSRS